MKTIEQRVTITEILGELKSNVPVDLVIAFENFLHDPDTDAKIEHEADRHRYSGSAQAYRESMRKVAEENFPNRSIPIDTLLSIHGHLFTFTQSQPFRDRIADIMELESRKLDAITERSTDLSWENAQLLQEIESLHIAEMPDEEIFQYTLKTPSQRLTFWENRLFKNDIFYKKIVALKS